MRLFRSLPVPTQLAQSLARIARTLVPPDARWIPPGNMHLTLVFLGAGGPPFTNPKSSGAPSFAILRRVGCKPLAVPTSPLDTRAYN
jgi:hypothetical protein